MSWTLYELSRHPEIQDALREEVLTVLEGRRIPDNTDVARMPLMKATVKEVLRYNSVILIYLPFTCFTLSDILFYFFPGYTQLFLPMRGSFQRKTLRWEATSFLKM